MSIDLFYDDKEKKIYFSCPSPNCAVRTKLLENLKAAGVQFVDKGCIIFVTVGQFSSTEDLEKKALSVKNTGQASLFAFLPAQAQAAFNSSVILNSNSDGKWVFIFLVS